MKFSSKNPLRNILGLMKQCPLCKVEYKMDTVKLVEEREGAHLVHITCSECGNAVLALIVISQLGMSSVGVITDLTFGDSVKFLPKPSISEDDLLNFHEILEKKQSLFIKSLIGKL
jgi:hypothetical protein